MPPPPAPPPPTGTLTLNKLKIYEQDVMVIEPGITLEESLMYGALSADIVGEEPIDMVLYNSYGKVCVCVCVCFCAQLRTRPQPSRLRSGVVGAW